MKILILFGSKYGTTEKCAGKLKEYINGDVEIININEKKNIELEKYNKIIIGSSIYVGVFNKKIKAFIKEHMEKLIRMDVSLFISCMAEGEELESIFKENISNKLLDGIKLKESLGGAFMFSKMNFFEKRIIKAISKKDSKLGVVDGKNDIIRINEEKIKNFAKQING